MIFNESKFNTHWPTKSLNELGRFNRGKSKHRPRNDERLFENGKYPLIQTGDVKAANLVIKSHSSVYNELGLSQSKLWHKGTLCITIAANIAETSLLGYDMCFPDSVVGFNAYDGESTEVFMHYIFSYIKKTIQNRTRGSIQDNINIHYLSNINFKIPPKSARKKIESILYHLDAKIEINNKINAELEAMAKLIYDYWFVQFDFPDENGKPYKSSGGKMVYNEELKREIPVGWEVKELLSYANITTGKLDSNAEVKNGKFHFYTCASKPTRTDTFAFDGSVILIAGNNAKGNFHVNRFSGKFNAYQRTYIITSIKDIYLDYLYHVVTYQMRVLKSRGKGSQTKFLTLGMITNIPVYETNSDTFQSFSRISKPLYSKQSKILYENQTLASLRDWLLPMLMNGQVSVGGE